MRKLILCLVAITCLCSVPAAACNQRCNYSTGQCETVGWTTFMACNDYGSGCFDEPVDCRAVPAPPDLDLAALPVTPPEATAICQN